MLSWIRKLWARWTTPECLHIWRPALANDKPAKYCSLCEACEQLTEGEFYAIFGRTTHRFTQEGQ